METNVRLQKVWRILCKLGSPYLEWKFNYSHDTMDGEGPYLIISNHVTDWDPLLLAISFPKRHVHFVASEHIFRLGWVSKLISYLVAPIPRRKGANGAATAMDCVRKLRAGNTVCVFAEGETTWDGVSNSVFPATGTLAKISGATLVTYRIEGGYLTLPRWGKGVRKGKMRGRVVNVYPPEQIKGMTPAQIEALMNADIMENAWERQKTEPVRYRSKRMAEGAELALFMCPDCKKIGSVVGRGNTVSCGCGMKSTMTDLGMFDPPVPFENMAQWDAWQHEQLKNGDFVHEGDLFADEGIALVEMGETKKGSALAHGSLVMTRNALTLGSYSFPLEQISDMALIQRRKLVFMCGEKYYEFRAESPKCLRKYLAVWKYAMKQVKDEQK